MSAKKQTRYLVASDFDQTLSFNDSGHVLGEIIGVKDFEAKVKALSSTYLVQSGAELAYLLRHDQEFKIVRREHLVGAGPGPFSVRRDIGGSAGSGAIRTGWHRAA